MIAGGGTGGHIFPAVAIAHAFKKIDPSFEIHFVGAKGKMEMEKIPQAGFSITGIDIAGFNRSSLIQNIGLPWKLVKSFFQVRRILQQFKPDAVIGVGGYSTFPVLKAAQMQGIPTFIHESNAFAGKANQWLGKRATKIFVAHEGMQAFFPKDRLVLTGNPVRERIVQAVVTKESGAAQFGLNAQAPIVFVTGGSLGARGINEAIASSLQAFVADGVQLIWQTGKSFADTAQSLCAGKEGLWTNDFIGNMEFAYAASDVVVSRSGAMAIAELCIVQKPTIFVPFPFAAEDHQTVNATMLVDQQAAMLVKDADAKTQLMPAILALVHDNKRQEHYKKNMAKLAIKDADQRVAQAIIKELETR